MKELFGVIYVDKPAGMTSHDVVDVARKKLRIKKIGHAGTLDPMATGLLILLVGRATKLSNRFLGLDKEYEAQLILGMKTDTADIMGKTTETRPVNVLPEDIVQVFSNFRGKIKQIPPMVSAIRHKGRRLYKLAKQGVEVERAPRDVEIYRLEIRKIEIPKVDFVVRCSKGTYIRKLCEDIGEALGCGATQSQLRRTMIGKIGIDRAIPIEAIDEGALRPVEI